MRKQLPPARLLMEIANNPSQDDFEASFAFVRSQFFDILEKAELDFNSFKNILDFGCGVGRFLYAISEDLAPHQTLFGCDISSRCANWCKNNIDFAQTWQSDIEPPLVYEDNHLSLIYACSVFSHLPIDYQLKWAQEIYRVISPGGGLFFTTHGPAYFPVLYQAIASQRISNSKIYSLGGHGLFLCSESGSSTAALGQREVASAHNQEAVAEIFPFFELGLHVPMSLIAGSQDTYVLRKPEQALPVVVARGQSDGKMFAGKSSQEGHYTAHLKGQDKFHGFIEFKRPFLGDVYLNTKVTGPENQSIFESRNLFASSKVFGAGMYYPVKFSMNPFNGPVNLTFSLEGVPADAGLTLIRPIFH